MKHVHKYIRIKLSNGTLKARCSIAGCAHYIPIELAVGRISICNICNNEFVLEKRHFKNAKLHCDDCFKKKESTNSIAAALEEMNK